MPTAGWEQQFLPVFQNLRKAILGLFTLCYLYVLCAEKSGLYQDAGCPLQQGRCMDWKRKAISALLWVHRWAVKGPSPMSNRLREVFFFLIFLPQWNPNISCLTCSDPTVGKGFEIYVCLFFEVGITQPSAYLLLPGSEWTKIKASAQPLPCTLHLPQNCRWRHLGCSRIWIFPPATGEVWTSWIPCWWGGRALLASHPWGCWSSSPDSVWTLLVAWLETDNKKKCENDNFKHLNGRPPMATQSA